MMYAESVKNRDIYPGILFLEYLHKPFLYNIPSRLHGFKGHEVLLCM